MTRGVAVNADSTLLTAPIPDGIGFAKSLTDTRSEVSFVEIFFVSIVAILLAFGFSVAINRKWLFDIAKYLRITRKFGDPDVWAFAFNTKEVSWATVRDLENNLMFAGYVRAYSDVEENAELFLSDVIVYNEKTGAELYRADRMYLSREKTALTIELPNPPVA